MRDATQLQGDIVAILDGGGNAVVEYSYDAWGKLLSTTTNSTSNCTSEEAAALGVHNLLRYRGYVYDTETQLYYLQSRYYDPEVGRFLNADALVATGQGILGNNMFAYCKNNPVVYTDVSGNACYPCTVHVNDSGMGVNHGTGCATPDEAAIAFADEEYRSNRETGAVIVRFYKNGEAQYTYDMVSYGVGSHVEIRTDAYRDDYVHNGAMMVGDIHTHGSSAVFSPIDIDTNNDILSYNPDYSCYLAGDNGRVYKYNANNRNQQRGDIIGDFTPRNGQIHVGATGSSPIISKSSLIY